MMLLVEVIVFALILVFMVLVVFGIIAFNMDMSERWGNIFKGDKQDE